MKIDELGRFVANPIQWHFEGHCIRCTSHAPNVSGYPLVSRNNVCVTIARHITNRRHGKLGRGIVARHTCDNRWCINPDHLLIGTIADNNHDRDIRGRAAIGVKSGRAKLSEDDVLSIRSGDETLLQIASRYGITRQHAGNILKRKSWKHI